MTLMIILGVIAGLYLILLMFRLASIALPLYAGIGAGFWMLDRGYGYMSSIAAGLLLGAFILAAGRFLCAILPAPWRGFVALAFVLPAAFAGYQAAKGLAGLALDEGLFLDTVGAAGALTIAVAAWWSLGGPRDGRAESRSIEAPS